MCKKKEAVRSHWDFPSPCLQALFKLKPSPLALAWAILQLCPSLTMYLADLDPDSLDWPETCFTIVNLSGNHWTVGWHDNSYWTCSPFLVRCCALCQWVYCPCQLCCHPSACGAAITHCFLTNSQPSSLEFVWTSYVSIFQDSCFLFRKPCLILADIMTQLDKPIFINQ